MPYCITKDNIKLFYKVDHADSAQVSALLLHGFGEHCQRYDDFVHLLNNHSISVLRFDFRGHGLSSGLKGHITSFKDYLEDLSCIGEVFENECKTHQKVLLAHSNGALVATQALFHTDQFIHFDAIVLSSPFFGLKVHVPWWKRGLAHGLSQFIPKFRLPTGDHSHLLSHDSQVEIAMKQDPLAVYQASARWFTETLKALDSVPQALKKFKLKNTPILWQVAQDDHIVDAQRTLVLFADLESSHKTLKLYEDCYHELWFEEENRKKYVLQDLFAFLSDALKR